MVIMMVSQLDSSLRRIDGDGVVRWRILEKLLLHDLPGTKAASVLQLDEANHVP